MQIDATAEGSRKPIARHFALFEYGFRPFFLLAGVYAIVAMGIWLVTLRTGAWPDGHVQPWQWHSHEMLFGFVTAAIAGFLLTAVPNWTGRKGFSGAPLIILVGLWLTGRAAMGLAGSYPIVMAAADLAFFPALAAILAPSLIKARRLHNLPFLLFLALLFGANLMFHLDWLGWTTAGVETGSLLGINAVMLMIAVIGGRIIPAFTLNGLRRAGKAATIQNRPWFDRTAIGVVALVLVVDLAAPGTFVAGVIALAAAMLHALRLGRWHGLNTFKEPILWILHVGYAWLVIALALKAAWLLTAATFAAFWLHALTIGAFATMILAVTTRAALGHTGRSLAAPKLVVLSYLLLTLAAAMRVFGHLLGIDYSLAVATAGLLWVGAFLLFVVVYTPILALSRPDGRPG